jgi:flagellar FliJ protein
MIPKPFSMDTVLKVRKREEDFAQQKFMQALEQQQKVENNLLSCKEKQNATIQLLAQKQQQGLIAVEMARFENKIEFNYRQINSLANLLQEKKQFTEKKRKILVQKSQEHKILETLKEQQNKNWDKYIEKKEAAMLDEIAILHHGRESF